MATISRRFLSRSSNNKQSLGFIIRNGVNWRLDYFSGIGLNFRYWTDHCTVKEELPDSDELNKTIDLIESNILAFIAKNGLIDHLTPD